MTFTIKRDIEMAEESNTTKIDIAPLTVIVSEGLDPRVRRKMEAEQQADVKTYQEMTRDMEVQEDLNKIKQEVNDKDDEESDPFKEPEAVENQTPQQQPADNSQPPADTQPAPAADPNTVQQPAQNPPAQDNPPAGQAQPATPADNSGQQPAAGGDEDLSSAFESHGMNLPKDLLRRVLKDYIKMESGDHDMGSLDHIKTFVYVDLGQNHVKGDTLESVQTLRDPENTILVIQEDGSPNADVTLRARKVAETLSNRGVKVFYDLEEAIDYLNELFDVVSGRKKGE